LSFLAFAAFLTMGGSADCARAELLATHSKESVVAAAMMHETARMLPLSNPIKGRRALHFRRPALLG
jgi:hypothetical protein